MQRGLARSRSQAQTLIATGAVEVNGVVVCQAARSVRDGDVVTATPDHYVSRGAHKLIGALEDLEVPVSGRALDAGASTGGFTQVLLERGCCEVFAVDVGRGQLADRIRDDPRVVVWEGTNLRQLSLGQVGGRAVDLVVADVSFISLTLLIEPLTSVLRRDGRLLLMIKPQFEVGRDRLGRGGVVRDPDLRRIGIESVLAAARQHGWFAHGVVPSRVLGSTGNQEYFALLSQVAPATSPGDSAALC